MYATTSISRKPPVFSNVVRQREGKGAHRAFVGANRSGRCLVKGSLHFSGKRSVQYHSDAIRVTHPSLSSKKCIRQDNNLDFILFLTCLYNFQ